MRDEIIDRVIRHAATRLFEGDCPLAARKPYEVMQKHSIKSLSLLTKLVMKAQVLTIESTITNNERIDLPLLGAFKLRTHNPYIVKIRGLVYEYYGIDSSIFTSLPDTLKCLITDEVYATAYDNIEAKRIREKEASKPKPPPITSENILQNYLHKS